MLVARILTTWAGVGAVAIGAAYAQNPPVVRSQIVDGAIQRAPDEAPLPAQTPVLTVNQAGLFDAHLRGVPLPEAMRMLSLQARRNITVSESVNATVTADLYQLTFEEALEALLTPGGYVWFPRGKFVYVCTPEEQVTAVNAGRNRELRIFELNFIPAADVRPWNMWGHATAQIFGSVSPTMHWDFGLKHEMRWLERWRLTYYGCCEPLDVKMNILRKIPNLRKISVSPWVNPERAVREIGTDYVVSRKPTPAWLAEDTWRPEAARADLVQFLETARGCQVEVIMKDISTVRYQPQRLWEWEKMAMEVVQE